MCGINGIVFMNGVVRSEEMLKQIRFVFNELLVETEDRGHHATGLNITWRDGSYEYYKAPLASSTMVELDLYFENLMGQVNDSTASIISHTRWYTKGKPENNMNNHPFDIGNITGVHNGTISNDDALFKEYEEKFARMAEVDSEIIYQLINHYCYDGVTLEGLKKALEDTKIRGLMALAFAHKEEPNLVHIVKQEKPMDIAFWQEAGIVIFNSDKKYIEAAFSKLNRAGRALGFTTSTTVDYTTPKDDVYFTIDSEGLDFASMISEHKKLYVLSSATKTYTGSTYRGTSTAFGTTTGNKLGVTAKDAVGKIIEGEVDEITGEIILYTASMTSTLNSDDGAGEDATGYCVECKNELVETEFNAAFNANNPEDERVCNTCYQEAMESALSS